MNICGRAIAYSRSAPGIQPVWMSFRLPTEGFVLLHAIERPGAFRVVEAEPGALIPLEDDPRRWCTTRLNSTMRACACGAIEVR